MILPGFSALTVCREEYDGSHNLCLTMILFTFFHWLNENGWLFKLFTLLTTAAFSPPPLGLHSLSGNVGLQSGTDGMGEFLARGRGRWVGGNRNHRRLSSREKSHLIHLRWFWTSFSQSISGDVSILWLRRRSE